MRDSTTVPGGENLRHALRWLSGHAPISRETINEAGLRFDLTPLEEEFLLREFLPHGEAATGQTFKQQASGGEENE